MIATIIISIITCLLLILSILVFPKITVFKKQINTYWIICLIGAIFILVFKCVPIKNVIDAMFSKDAINPIKILLLFISMTFLSIFLEIINFSQASLLPDS